jgi:hypothetical protein
MLYEVSVKILDEKADEILSATKDDLVLILHVNPD